MPINIFQEKGYYFAQYENVVDADHPPVTTSSILIPFYKFSTFLQRFGIAGYDALTCRGRVITWDTFDASISVIVVDIVFSEVIFFNSAN
eukprot:Awhi_evm1s15664